MQDLLSKSRVQLVKTIDPKRKKYYMDIIEFAEKKGIDKTDEQKKAEEEKQQKIIEEEAKRVAKVEEEKKTEEEKQ